MKEKKVIINIVTSILVYSSILILSIIVSRYVLLSYGSEVNGLVSSINQIFSYVALFEAGIGTATIAAFYSPIFKRDDKQISDVFFASKNYYINASKWYFLCVCAVSIIWPLVINTTIDYKIIFFFILIQGISGVVTFCYISSIMNYLVASGKNYINSNVHFIITILTYLSKIVICYFKLNIVFLSLAALLINLIKCLFYTLYLKKAKIKFKKNNIINKSLLKQKNAFLVHEISGVVFSSTDTIVLSLFCSLSIASVYAIYSMVLTSINTILGQILNGCYFILGDSFNKKKDEYIKTHDIFNIVYITAVFFMFTVVYILILPFIKLYTAGINDVNYIDANLPVLFVLIQLLSACRMVDNYAIKIALHAKQTINRTIIETVINLVTSVILVQFLGIYGVLLGTIVALLYRTNDIIIYVNKKVLIRSCFKEYKLYLSNFLIFFLILIFNFFNPIDVDSYFELLIKAIYVGIFVLIIYVSMNFIINYGDLLPYISKIKKLIKK